MASNAPGPFDPPRALSAAAVAALHHGHKIEAIKITRQEQGIDLKAAKEAVEAYLRSQPALASSLAAAQARSGGTVVLWLAVLACAALLAYRFLFNN